MVLEGRERRALASRRAPVSDRFDGARALQLFMENFHM
jgi:hypothetical protein